MDHASGLVFHRPQAASPRRSVVYFCSAVLRRLRASALASGLVDGVVAASLGLIVAVTWHLGRAAIVDLSTAALLVASGLALVVWRPNSTWLIMGGAVLGWILRGGGRLVHNLEFG